MLLAPFLSLLSVEVTREKFGKDEILLEKKIIAIIALSMRAQI